MYSIIHCARAVFFPLLLLSQKIKRQTNRESECKRCKRWPLCEYIGIWFERFRLFLDVELFFFSTSDQLTVLGKLVDTFFHTILWCFIGNCSMRLLEFRIIKIIMPANKQLQQISLMMAVNRQLDWRPANELPCISDNVFFRRVFRPLRENSCPIYSQNHELQIFGLLRTIISCQLIICAHTVHTRIQTHVHRKLLSCRCLSCSSGLSCMHCFRFHENWMYPGHTYQLHKHKC